jgi:hypothetical protein
MSTNPTTTICISSDKQCPWQYTSVHVFLHLLNMFWSQSEVQRNIRMQKWLQNTTWNFENEITIGNYSKLLIYLLEEVIHVGLLEARKARELNWLLPVKESNAITTWLLIQRLICSVQNKLKYVLQLKEVVIWWNDCPTFVVLDWLSFCKVKFTIHSVD